MGDKVSSPTEETGATATPETGGAKAPRDLLEAGRRSLSPEELNSPTVAPFLISMVEKLEADCQSLGKFRDQYWEQTAKIARLEEKGTASKAYELLAFAVSSLGSAGLGASLSVLTTDPKNPLGWIFFFTSLVLVLSGIGTRFIK